MSFTVLCQDGGSRARGGELGTRHGTVATPVFLPVASKGTVKTLSSADVTELGFGMLLANTYHLYLQPGLAVIEKAGGLHRFMAWDGAILTDSGGYQVFSLASLRKVDEEGVTFRSHIDGSEHRLTPELAVAFQETLGSDIAMVLDECPPFDGRRDAIEAACERTLRWAERCLKAKKRADQDLFAIVQGAGFADLRRHSAEQLAALDFPGYAIGGLSLGEPKAATLAAIEATVPFLPAGRPRYLMGVGSPEDLVEGVARGIDIFDCALPTRVARNGSLFTATGRVNIRNAGFGQDMRPVEPGCDCPTCRSYSAAYLHHLFDARELLAYRLATVHNLFFVNRLMREMRQAIVAGDFAAFRKEFLGRYRTTDEPVRLAQKRKWLRKAASGPEDT